MTAPDTDFSPSPPRQYMQTHDAARAAEVELLAEHADSRAAELEAKRRLVRLRSELNRSRTHAALRGVSERRRAAAHSVRTSQDERTGLKVRRVLVRLSVIASMRVGCGVGGWV